MNDVLLVYHFFENIARKKMIQYFNQLEQAKNLKKKKDYHFF
jgi:hypothetical protein